MSWTDRVWRALRRVDVSVATTLALVFAPVIGALVFLFYAFAAREALEEIDRRARHRLEEVGQTLAETPGSDSVAALAALGAALAREGIGFELRDHAGRILTRSGPTPDPARLQTFERGFLAAALVPGENSLRYAREYPSGLRAEVSVTLVHFAEERGELARTAWICLAGGLGAAVLVALLATRRAMAPLRDATASLARIDARQLDARLPLRGTGDDVDRHASAVNRVLERLEGAFARMSAFSSDVAHELRTPVNRILNLAEVALMGGEDAQVKALGPVREAADEMSRLVEGLLMLARGEQGQLGLSVECLPVAALLSDLERLYAPACEERGIRLETSAAGDTVRADRTLLFRALANLLDNAIRFTPRGGRIRVEAAPVADGELSIRVSDSGRGIPVADREVVFERFTRLDAARSGPGTGLGLPIARMIARVHGGELVATDSTLGGVCLAMRLPAVPPAPTLR